MTEPGPGASCECGTELAPALLACPACHRLVHREALDRLAREARAAEGAGDALRALSSWREALELLPSDSRQAAVVAERVTSLRDRVDEPAPDGRRDDGPRPGTRVARILAPLGVVGLLIWKFKAVALLLLGKLKFVALGLAQLGTVSTMLASLGIYGLAWGWPLALGLLLSLYLHEMGHVAAMARYGMALAAPMFVPGVGAFVRLRQRPVDGREDARIGLAGPIWGLAAALLSAILWAVTGAPIFGAIARAGAWINLFNLLPIWQLDGGRAFRALGRGGRGIAAVALAIAFVVSREGLLVLLALVAAVRVLQSDAPPTDRRTVIEYVGLVASLSALASLPVPPG